ncbi:hypothetical protein [Streptomyces sp. NPDC007904]|uniref:hypothetical protein n=1 Tax=Streptomyces sp. NPDC007904 TaxID=3364787 RepID=UPI0036E5D586
MAAAVSVGEGDGAVARHAQADRDRHPSRQRFDFTDVLLLKERCARVLHELGEHRQVVVFTYDTRFQRAFTGQELRVTVFEVERSTASRVSGRPVTEPVRQALGDVRALVGPGDLPKAARTHVLPSLCRIALENALLKACPARKHDSGA